MLKILLQSAILLTLLGPLPSLADEAVLPKKKGSPVSAPQSEDLGLLCRKEARQIHDVGVFPRKQPKNSAVVRRHALRLIKFCDAYDGGASEKFWDQISATNEPIERREAFLNACLAEANGGRATVFRPSREHIVRMSAICQEMAQNLPRG